MSGGPPHGGADGDELHPPALPSGRGAVALLAEDPDLAAGIPDDERGHAERLVVVPGLVVEPGPWAMTDVVEEPHLGVVVLDGFVTVEVGLVDRVASQLAGPGDVLHGEDRTEAALPARLAYTVSDTARLAVLDRRFIAAVRRWPELLVALHERLRAQEHRLAVHAAIGKLRRVEDRVLAALWHLGERWGRMGADGVVVPLRLTHETIGRLAGAERPTVSLALAALGRTGEVRRREDGAFVLQAGSSDRLAPLGGSRPQARPLAVERTPEPVGEVAATEPPVTGSIDRAALHRRVAALRDDLPERSRAVDELLAASRASAARSRATRQRLSDERAARAPD